MSLTRVIFRIAFIIFAAEGLVSLALYAFAPELNHIGLSSMASLAVTDAGIVVLLASPVIYFWAVRPYILAQQQAERTLREAVESISEGFQMYDADDRLVLCNSKFLELYSMSSDLFVVGNRFEDILRAGVDRGQFPEAIGRESEWIADRMQQHRQLRNAIERRLPNGRWVKITETRTPTGHTVGIRTDISELKNREQDLRRSEERLRHVVDSLQEGFVLYDADDRLVMWNEKWLENHREVRDLIKVGSSFEDLVRANVARKAYPEAFGREEEFVAERIRDHRNPGEPMIRQLHDGRWYIIREVPTAEGGIFAISIDITELKKAEEAAQQARMQAETADRAKSEFLTNMSHELRTPLNAVIGFSDIIKNETFGPAGSKYADYAKDINQSGRHLLALINDILDLSKVESGMDELHEELVKASEIADAAINLVQARALEKSVEIVSEVPEDAPSLRADKRKLIQILVNLLSNAVKFTEAEGTVTLSMDLAEDGGFVYRVTDTGIGISREHLATAMSQFGQVDNSLTRENEGTGLGLPLTKALVELHGGTFDLQSEVGTGTTVTVHLPAWRNAAGSVATGQPAAA